MSYMCGVRMWGIYLQHITGSHNTCFPRLSSPIEILRCHRQVPLGCKRLFTKKLEKVFPGLGQ